MKFAVQKKTPIITCIRVTCAKELSDLNFNQAVIGKISIFKKLPQISHFHKNLNFFKYIWNDRNTLSQFCQL